MLINNSITAQSLRPAIEKMWARSAEALRRLDRWWDPVDGSPVITSDGRYISRDWTEWTQGFQFGSLLLQYEATGEQWFLDRGRDYTLKYMAPHVSHVGVHDHGFNNVSTYGTLRRQILAGRCPDNGLLATCELALKVSGAIQAARWTKTHDGSGFIYSFNGPHSLFCDTIRSLRSLGIAHSLGHRLMAENDEKVSLLERLIEHARTTARYSVYYGENRDHYDVRGRVAHESLFNPNDGRYRCPSTQQGYSPFSTWTRGLAWIMLGYAEQLQYLETVRGLDEVGERDEIEAMMLKPARATCDFYIENTSADGIPYWDTGAPGLVQLGDWRSRPADPFNDYESVDSSAAAIACQGLLRLSKYLEMADPEASIRYEAAGLTVLKTLLSEPYLSRGPEHEGLLLHSVYHRPRGWDPIPIGRKIPCGESSQWGDYHLREAALLAQQVGSW